MQIEEAAIPNQVINVQNITESRKERETSHSVEPLKKVHIE